MEGSVSLGRAGRKRLLEVYRRSPEPAVRLRAHIILLLAMGYPWALITATLFCSTRTIDRWKKRFEGGGVGALLGDGRGRRPVFGGGLIEVVVHWVKAHVPRDFGFVRSRWCCGTLVTLMAEMYHVRVSRETVR